MGADNASGDGRNTLPKNMEAESISGQLIVKNLSLLQISKTIAGSVIFVPRRNKLAICYYFW